jgi:uncharacterized membrane protein
VSWPLQAVSWAVLLVDVVAFALIIPRLPASVPLHFDAAGVPDRFGPPGEHWQVIVTPIFLIAVLWVTTWVMAAARFAVPEGRPERWLEVEVQRRRLMVRMVEVLLAAVQVSQAAMFISIAASGLPGMERLRVVGLAAGVLGALAAAVGAFVGFVPPLDRLTKELEALGGGPTTGTRPSGWRAGGLFYYAPEDPAVFVPKRLGIGYTVNFGRPGGWLFLGALLIVPAAIAVWRALAGS